MSLILRTNQPEREPDSANRMWQCNKCGASYGTLNMACKINRMYEPHISLAELTAEVDLWLTRSGSFKTGSGADWLTRSERKLADCAAQRLIDSFVSVDLPSMYPQLS